MIEEIIIPKEEKYSLQIPPTYIGKSLKIIIFPLEEASNNEPKPEKKLSELAGLLSHETAEEMQKYVAESRSEWEERLNKQL